MNTNLVDRNQVFQLKSPIISDGGVDEWETASERSCAAIVKDNKPLLEAQLEEESSNKLTRQK